MIPRKSSTTDHAVDFINNNELESQSFHECGFPLNSEKCKLYADFNSSNLIYKFQLLPVDLLFF